MFLFVSSFRNKLCLHGLVINNDDLLIPFTDKKKIDDWLDHSLSQFGIFSQSWHFYNLGDVKPE